MTDGPFAVGLKSFLAQERIRVEEALGVALHTILPGIPQEFRDALQHGVTSGGKRLRPILCVAAYRAVGGESQGIYSLAVSLELIHAYSLMHDDLPCMDDADLRRGEATTHKVHGEAATTVAGALLIPAATRQAWDAAAAMGLAQGTGRALVEELSRAAGGGGMVGDSSWIYLGKKRSFQLTISTTSTDGRRGSPYRFSPDGRDRRRRPPGCSVGIGSIRSIHRARIPNCRRPAGCHCIRTRAGKEPFGCGAGKSTYVSLFGVEEAGRRARELVAEAVKALRDGGLVSPELETLAHYIVDRNR